VVNLKVAFLKRFAADRAATATIVDQGDFEHFRKGLASANKPAPNRRRVAETVCCYIPAIGTLDSESLNWYALLPYVPGGSRMMIITVFRFEFFRGDESVFEDVFDDRAGTLCSNGVKAGDKFFW
jgi:hypothetical protein